MEVKAQGGLVSEKFQKKGTKRLKQEAGPGTKGFSRRAWPVLTERKREREVGAVRKKAGVGELCHGNKVTLYRDPREGYRKDFLHC